MTQPHDELFERLRELVKDAGKIASHAEEAAKHHSTGDLGSVASIVGLMHYPLSQVSSEVTGILEQLAGQGIHPGFE